MNAVAVSKKASSISDLDEASLRSFEWRVRLTEQLLGCKDPELFLTLLIAGYDQAHSDGLEAAADLVGSVAKHVRSDPRMAERVLGLETAERGIRDLRRRNEASNAASLVGPTT